MKQLSQEIFGTDDYQGILSALSPSDYLAKKFVKVAMKRKLITTYQDIFRK